MRDVELAYLAGVVDSDGFITINRRADLARPRFSPVVGICGTRTQPHELAAELFGGRPRAYKNRDSPRPMWEWTRAGASAIPALDALLPYLRVKQEQGELAIECAMVASQQATIGVDLVEQLDELHTEIRGLNQWRREATYGR